MRQALDALQRGDVSGAAEHAQDAGDGLRELHREMSGAAPRDDSIDQARLEAEQLAESQRRLGHRAQQLGRADRQAAADQLADDEGRLADRVEALGDRLQAVRSTADPEGAAAERATEVLDQEEVASEMRTLAEMMRRSEEDLGAIQERSARLSEALSRVADQLVPEGRANSVDNDDAATPSGTLDEAQALADRLAAIDAQLSQMGEPAAAEDGSSGASSRPSLPADLVRQIDENGQIMDHLRREHPTLARELERWAESWQTSAAPGTEAFKQDLSEWSTLVAEVRLALEEFEIRRSQAAVAEALGDRPYLPPAQRAPERYRHLIDEYYRSLASDQP